MALIRAVLDTSIYVSALLASKGDSGRILEAGFARRLFVPVTPP
jgi:predicted nucleic acid-binding protein